MNQKILCVDDDINILQAFKRGLRKDFDVYVAEGGEQALAVMETNGPFAVIVSDMRMPGMDGVQFLSKVKEIAPETVRMMLTGNADQQTAIDAVNEGSIFRFLTKPCETENLAKALNAGLEQYRLITAEKHLLEETLNKSLQVMVEILALVNTTAFSRSTRIKRLARDIARKLQLNNVWEIEIAAMLSQIGCITVPEETLQKIADCEPLTEEELRLYHRHPQVAHDLVGRIPRMQTVAEIIANQNRRTNDDSETNLRTDSRDTVRLGSRILKTVLDFDKLLDSSNLPHNAFHELSQRIGWYDPIVLNALKELLNENVEEYSPASVEVARLKPGMLLNQSIFSTRGALLLSAGQEITLSLILRLINFAEAGIIEDKIQVKVPSRLNQ
jgi:response regulator RpfG family c-di-GMP phosphodiesterase